MQETQESAKLARLNSFLSEDPDNPHILSEMAHLSYIIGKREDATTYAQRAVSAGVDGPLSYNILGLVASDAGDMENAATHFAHSLQLGESDPYILFRQAQALALTRRFVEAEAPAREAAGNPERAPDAEALLARVLHYQGKMEEAVTVAEAAIAQGRASARLYAMLSTLYIDLEDFDKSAEAAKQALGLVPDEPEALAAQGLVSLKQLEPETAQAEFRTAIEKSPRSGRAHLGMGLALMLQGKLPDAAESLHEATVCMPTHLGTFQALAWCHILNKNVAAARTVLEHAYELNHNFAETHGALSIVSLMEGDLAAARKYAQQASRLDNTSMSAQFAQVLIQQVGGDGAKASQMMTNLMTKPVLPDGQSIQQVVAAYLAKQA